MRPLIKFNSGEDLLAANTNWLSEVSDRKRERVGALFRANFLVLVWAAGIEWKIVEQVFFFSKKHTINLGALGNSKDGRLIPRSSVMWGLFRYRYSKLHYSFACNIACSQWYTFRRIFWILKVFSITVQLVFLHFFFQAKSFRVSYLSHTENSKEKPRLCLKSRAKLNSRLCLNGLLGCHIATSGLGQARVEWEKEIAQIESAAGLRKMALQIDAAAVWKRAKVHRRLHAVDASFWDFFFLVAFVQFLRWGIEKKIFLNSTALFN